MQEFIFKAGELDAGTRLDLSLMRFCDTNNIGLSRMAIQRMINEGMVTLEGLSLNPHYKVKLGDEFKIALEEKEAKSFEPENIPLEIVYEDADLAIISKPCGLVVHPAAGNYTHTLVNALLFHFKNLSSINPQRPGIVHRLDKDTSGLLMITKNNAAHLKLAEQFAAHSIKRKYIAIVQGVMEFDEHIIEVPIGRHLYKRENMAVKFGKDSRDAKTYYRTLKRGKDASLVELHPFTGRTHQLRVHLAFIGHPVLGDVKYGRADNFSRLALHSFYIGFIHPSTGKFKEFSSSIPVEFTEFMSKNSPCATGK